MGELWATLIPLAIASAVVPIHIVITVLLLRSKAGRLTAVAWVAGLTATRLVQGLVFGLILGAEEAASDSPDEPALIVSILILVLGVLLLAAAGRTALADDDPDAPPPRWMAAVDSIGPAKAFLLGAGLVAIGAKFWVFTLTALGAIGAADLSRPAGALAYLAFVALAQSVILTVVAIAFIAPRRSEALLDRMSSWLETHNRVIVIALGVVFGLWFLAKGLSGLGVL